MGSGGASGRRRREAPKVVIKRLQEVRWPGSGEEKTAGPAAFNLAPQRSGRSWRVVERARRGPPGRQSFCPEPPSLEDHCKARRYAPVVEHATLLCRLLESGMELTRAERQIDYVSDSGNKDWITFLKKPGWDRIRIILFVRKVEKDLWDFTFSGRHAGVSLDPGSPKFRPKTTHHRPLILSSGASQSVTLRCMSAATDIYRCNCRCLPNFESLQDKKIKQKLKIEKNLLCAHAIEDVTTKVQRIPMKALGTWSGVYTA